MPSQNIPIAVVPLRLWIAMRRFAVEALCLLMLLYGAPLQALEAALPHVEVDVPKFSLGIDEILDDVGQRLGTARQTTVTAASNVTQQPWADAFTLMLTTSSFGSTQEPSVPPSPPSETRATQDGDLAGVTKGFGDKDALDTIPLLPGWNQISLPEAPGTSDPATVLATIGGSYAKVYAYDGCDPDDPWKVYDPADPVGGDLTSIDVTQGLLVDATAAVELPSDGTLPDSTTFQLCTGWNLIGFPSAQPRHVRSALAPILDKVVRVFAFDPFDLDDPWAFFEKDAPDWASDLDTMEPGRGYWILVTEDVDLEIKNVGDAPDIAFTSPLDLDVVTAPTAIHGRVTSDLLESWRLRYRGVGEVDWVELASGNYPVDGKLGDFDPTLLLNGMYELELTATDLQGLQVTDSIAVVVEGNMKIGHFTLSFVDLAIPLSGLDIEVVRTYDSRQRHLQGDFGYGWSLDIRQGSYRNNRPPGDGWQIRATEGPWGLPCSPDAVLETKSHLTTIRLSDQEVYRFRLVVEDPGTIIGGCIGRADFEFVDGPIPGATLEILGNTSVLYQNNTDELRNPDTFELYVPEDVKLTTRDGRIFHLDLADGVTHLEDLNGNTLGITPEGITHSSGRSVEFVRDAEGRIERITDPMGNANVYSYDTDGDHVTFTDRIGAETQFVYADGHYLEDIVNALGVRAVRTEYSEDGRVARMIDAAGQAVALDHDLTGRREVITNRLGFIRILEYNTRGNVVREVDELGNAIFRGFDSKDRLLVEENALGEKHQYAYNAWGDLVSITDPKHHRWEYFYDHKGRPILDVDPTSITWTRTYDENGNELTAINSFRTVETYTYDAQGNVLSEESGDSIFRYEYDDYGQLTKTMDPLGTQKIYNYNQVGNLVGETLLFTQSDGSQGSASTSYEVDALGRLTQITYPDGHVERREYTATHQLLRQTDVLGRTTEFHFDPKGQLVTTSFPDLTTEQRVYDAEGRVTARTDREGRTTSATWDAKGQLLTTTLPDGAKLRSVYDSAGRITALIDALGNTRTLSYDAAGQIIHETFPDGSSRTTSYDAGNRPITLIDPLGHRTEIRYDPTSGRMTEVERPDQGVLRFEYDSSGRRIATTQPLGQQINTRFDPLGRLIEVTDPIGAKTTYSYDTFGNRIQQSDANGHSTHFDYDIMGRLKSRTLPDGSTETFEYDPIGNLTLMVDALGQETTFAYDVNDRLDEQRLPNGQSTLYSYSPEGKRLSAQGENGTTLYEYDDVGRFKSLTLPGGEKLHYTYDLSGNLKKLETQFGEHVDGTSDLATHYSYDAMHRLIKVTDHLGQQYDYEYDENGRLTQKAYPNGIRTLYTYDSVGRTTRIETANATESTRFDFLSTYDSNGRPQQIIEPWGTRHLTFDDASRLVQERLEGNDGQNQELRFTYDGVGNRLSRIHLTNGEAVESLEYSYDERDRLLMASTQEFTWNANGQLLSDGARSFSWDPQGRLIQASTPTGDVVEHRYDLDGTRIETSTTDSEGATNTQRFVTDTTLPVSQVLAELDESNSLLRGYTRGHDHVSKLHDLLAIHISETSQFVHTDTLGSVRALTDENGALIEEYNYWSFGKSIDSSESETALPPYGFTGEAFEPGTGLYYHRARWLQPETGRWASPDPWPGEPTLPRTLNDYVYVGNNPASATDPLGLFEFSVIGLSISLNAQSIGRLSQGSRAIEFLTRGLRNKKWDLYFVGKKSNVHWLIPHFYIYAEKRKSRAGFTYDIGPNQLRLGNMVRGPGGLAINGATRVSAFKNASRIKIAPHNQKQFMMWNFYAAASTFAPLSTERITYGFLGPFVGTSCLSWTLSASVSAWGLQFFPVK